MGDHFAGAKDAGASADEIRRVLVMAMMVAGARTKHFIMDNLEGVEPRP